MQRLIDAYAFRREIDTYPPFDKETQDSDAMANHAKEILLVALNNMPTIDAEPVRYGEWIKADSQQYFRKHYPCFTCSECGYRKDSQKKWNYCPHCRQFPFIDKFVDATLFISLIMYPRGKDE